MGAQTSCDPGAGKGGKPNTAVPAGANFSKPKPSDTGNKVHLLITANDYKNTANPLTCSMDGRNMEELANLCGVDIVVAMYDDECQKDLVADKLREMAQNVEEDDVFIFYYSGHGANLPDQDGEEADGQDEALCFTDANGQVNYNSCMRDDDFAELMTSTLKPCRLIILTDCCHSGSIADLSKECWDDFQVISITGCKDGQTSGDVGTGGIFTHSMLVALQKLVESGEDDFSIGMLYNVTLKYDDSLFHSEQDITLTCGGGATSDSMVWPLVPPDTYKSPLMRARSLAIPSGDASDDEDEDEDKAADMAGHVAADLNACAQAGVSPAIAHHMQTISGAKLNIEDIKAQAAKEGCSVM
eukprot:TRINITY_DN112122_c0_g1_i1.p1 TRINITY_DN112122_c0_g1~~TRINITY_DN112122_c0_g1_i1.p1  ORF type:complete len:357 (-),score=82.49 TRINITY_DN112122_c0_g1_i1:112-1182(-)